MSAWFFKIIIAREKYFFNSEVLLYFKILKVRKTPIFRKNTCFKESIQKTPQTLGALGDFRDRWVTKKSEKLSESPSQHQKCAFFCMKKQISAFSIQNEVQKKEGSRDLFFSIDRLDQANSNMMH
jgi:hypothetical protein